MLAGTRYGSGIGEKRILFGRRGVDGTGTRGERDYFSSGWDGLDAA